MRKIKEEIYDDAILALLRSWYTIDLQKCALSWGPSWFVDSEMNVTSSMQRKRMKTEYYSMRSIYDKTTILPQTILYNKGHYYLAYCLHFWQNPFGIISAKPSSMSTGTRCVGLEIYGLPCPLSLFYSEEPCGVFIQHVKKGKSWALLKRWSVISILKVGPGQGCKEVLNE